MALRHPYPEDFERIWHAYPMWPAGRSKKQEAYRKWKKVKADLKIEPHEVEEIIETIEKMKMDRESWQPGNQFGPVGLQVFIFNHAWNDDYVRKKRGNFLTGSGFVPDAEPKVTPWEAKGMTEEAYKAENERAHQNAMEKLRKMGMLKPKRSEV